MLRSIVAAGLALIVAGQQPADEQIRPQAIKEHLFYLADDALEGRGIGTRGHRLAAKYAAEHFEALKLEPAGDNKTYLPKRKGSRGRAC